MGLAALTVKANQSFLYPFRRQILFYFLWDSYSTYNQRLRPNNFHSLLKQLTALYCVCIDILLYCEWSLTCLKCRQCLCIIRAPGRYGWSAIVLQDVSSSYFITLPNLLEGYFPFSKILTEEFEWCSAQLRYATQRILRQLNQYFFFFEKSQN